MADRPIGRAGFEFRRLTRVALPDIGMMVLAFLYGEIDGKRYGPKLGDPTVTTTPNLDRNEIVLMALGNDGLYRVQWWGTVESQLEIEAAPGADYPLGAREYHCEAGLKRTMRWPLVKHGFYNTAATMEAAVGHPGFNIARWDGRIAGNRDSSNALWNAGGDLTGTIMATPSARCFYHTSPGCGALWTDQQAVEEALCAARPVGEVVFYLSGAVGLFSGTSAWPTVEGEPVFNLLTRICRRQRGRGLVYEDWDETPTANPSPATFAAFKPKLVVRSPFYDDIVYTPPGGGGPVTLPGALSQGSTTSVDLVGDRRLGPEARAMFRLGARNEHVVDYLESVAEHIEVVITPSFVDAIPSWEARWLDAEATSYKASSYETRLTLRYDPVYQLYGLPLGWGGRVGDGDGGTASRADYRCLDDGSIKQPDLTDPLDTAVSMVSVLSDLPMYAEYNYSVNPPVRYDAQGADPLPPVRRKPLFFFRPSAGAFIPLAPIQSALAPPLLSGLSYQVSEFGFKLFVAGDDLNGVRTIGDTAGNIGSSINYQAVVPTIGIKLPHRVRIATAAAGVTAATAKRALRIEHRNLHLWLAHPLAIWDVDPNAVSSTGYGVKRAAAGGAGATPGILRDDRPALAQLHALAWAWYGSARRTAQWSRHAMGTLPAGTMLDGAGNETQVPFEKLGDFITILSAQGINYVLHTPITAIHIDNVTGITTWVTDWSTFDYRQ